MRELLLQKLLLNYYPKDDRVPIDKRTLDDFSPQDKFDALLDILGELPSIKQTLINK